MSFFGELRRLGRRPGFRWLLLVRLFSQSSDGIFQVALASSILFNPEKGATPREIAVAFAVVLLPYSLLGPFVGVLIDRWSRRRILVVAQTLRTLVVLGVGAALALKVSETVFFALVLLVFSLNRFVLAAISASLPHLVEREDLVGANAIVPTFGTMCYTLGLGVGAGVRSVTSDPAVCVIAAGGALSAAYAASRLPFVGPDKRTVIRSIGAAVVDVARGLGDAARHLPRRAKLLLLMVACKRMAVGMLLVQTGLLFRNHFAAQGDTRVGFAATAVATALGFVAAALLVPSLAPRVGLVRYAVWCYALAGLLCLVPGLALTQWSSALIGGTTAALTQGPKICIDSLLQRHVPDRYLGRTFAVHDVMFNGATVAAACVAAFVLPVDGFSRPFMGLIGAWLLLTALVLAVGWRRARQRDTVDPDPLA